MPSWVSPGLGLGFEVYCPMILPEDPVKLEPRTLARLRDKQFTTEPSSIITRRQILDCFKLKEFADDNFKFDENSRKLSNWVENTVGKGEITRYEQFLLFSTVFSKGLFPRSVKRCHCTGTGSTRALYRYYKHLQNK